MSGVDLSKSSAPISSFGVTKDGSVVLSAFNLINSMDYNIFYSMTSSDTMSTLLVSNFYYKSASQTAIGDTTATAIKSDYDSKTWSQATTGTKLGWASTATGVVINFLNIVSNSSSRELSALGSHDRTHALLVLLPFV